MSLPPIPAGTDYAYFTCFQLWSRLHPDNESSSSSSSSSEFENYMNETDLQCYKSIPNQAFNISDLVTAVYEIRVSLLLCSASNVNDMHVLKQELIIFSVHGMYDFHAAYQWQAIEPHHSVLNGLDVKMDIQTNDKLVKIPTQWTLQLFISSSYRLLWLLVSKSTTLASIKSEIAQHTGIDAGCIDIVKHHQIITDRFATVESIDWFYHKYDISIAIDPSLFCRPIQCGFGYRNINISLSESSLCDFTTDEYKQTYVRNKGRMYVDISNPWDSLMTLSF